MDNEDDSQNYWCTTVGKFKIAVKDLPQPLQYIYQLLQVESTALNNYFLLKQFLFQELSNVEKPAVLYYMLQCLNILCLHGDACTKASKDHRGFFIWCQENLLIKQ